MSKRYTIYPVVLFSLIMTSIITFFLEATSHPVKFEKLYQLNSDFTIKLKSRDYSAYKVPDGWLLRSHWDSNVTFVPDKKHVWQMRLSGQKTLEKHKKE